jgi:hypothetical protein
MRGEPVGFLNGDTTIKMKDFLNDYYKQYVTAKTALLKNGSVTLLTIDEFKDSFRTYTATAKELDRQLRQLFQSMLHDKGYIPYLYEEQKKLGQTLREEEMENFRRDPDPQYLHYQKMKGRSPLWEFEQKLDGFWATGFNRRLPDFPDDWDWEVAYQKFVTFCGSKAEAKRVHYSAYLLD